MSEERRLRWGRRDEAVSPATPLTLRRPLDVADVEHGPLAVTSLKLNSGIDESAAALLLAGLPARTQSHR